MSSCLDRVAIAAPCPITWDEMPGDQKVRHCTGCAKNVYNISAMSTVEAEKFLSKSEGQCLRFFRRTDGTIITDNCPVGLRAIRNKLRLWQGLAAGFLSSVFSISMAHAQTAPLAGEPTIDTTKTDSSSSIEGKSVMKKVPAKDQAPVLLGGKPGPIKGPTTKGTTMVSADDCPSATTPDKALAGRSGGLPVKSLPTARPPIESAGLVAPNFNQANPPAPKPVEKSENKIKPDTTALDLLENARKANAKGDFLLASVYYKDAIKATKANDKSDAKFVMMLMSEYKAFEKKMLQPK